MIKVAYSKGIWEVTESFTSTIKGYSIEVPTGFKTDLASTPRFLWAIYPPFGDYNEGAIVHDYLYTTAWLPRRECDKLLYALVKRESGKFTATVFYVFVRLLGWRRYAK